MRAGWMTLWSESDVCILYSEVEQLQVLIGFWGMAMRTGSWNWSGISEDREGQCARGWDVRLLYPWLYHVRGWQDLRWRGICEQVLQWMKRYVWEISSWQWRRVGRRYGWMIWRTQKSRESYTKKDREDDFRISLESEGDVHPQPSPEL